MFKYCEPCRKSFKSNTLYMSHIKTKRHQELVDGIMHTFLLLAMEEMRRKFGEEEFDEFRKYCLSFPPPEENVKYDLPPNMWNMACKNIVRIVGGLRPPNPPTLG